LLWSDGRLLRHLQAVDLHARQQMPEGVRLGLGVQQQPGGDLLHVGRQRGAEPEHQGPLLEPRDRTLSEGVQSVFGLHVDRRHPDLLQWDLLGHVPKVVPAEQRLHRQDLLQVAHLDEPRGTSAHLQSVAELLGHAPEHDLRAMRLVQRELQLPRMRDRGRDRGLLGHPHVFLLDMRERLWLQQHALRGLHRGDGRGLHGHAELHVVSELPDLVLR